MLFMIEFDLIAVSLGTYKGPNRNWKQCLCKILEGQTKRIMVFLIVANIVSLLHHHCTLLNNAFLYFSQCKRTSFIERENLSCLFTVSL